MRRQQHQEHVLEEQDEHNAPTEPLPQVMIPIDHQAIPAPQAYEHPFPQQGGFPSPGVMGRPPVTSVYPYLPPAPAMSRWGRPAGGAIPMSPVGADKPMRSHARRSAWPLLVGMFFTVVRLLLLARFVLKIVSWPGDTGWVGMIYTTSDVFVLPFRLLLQSVAFPLTILDIIEIYTLLAIFSYWLLSRVLVHFLKAVLNSG